MDPTAESTTSPNPTPNRSFTALRDALADRVMLRNDLRLYIRQAWHVVEPSTVYLENWHIDLIAEHLEAVTAGSDLSGPSSACCKIDVHIDYVADVSLGARTVSRQAAQSGPRGPTHETRCSLDAKSATTP